MSEKLTLESVVEKLNCDCDTCKFEHDYQIDCKAAREEGIKELIKQILEQVRPKKQNVFKSEDGYFQMKKHGYNECVEKYDFKVKEFLETSK